MTDYEAHKIKLAAAKVAPKAAYREFVEREREAILATLTKSAELNARMRALAEREIERLEAGALNEDEDVVRSIGALAKTVDVLRTSDAGIAALEADQRWRNQELQATEVKAGDDFMDLRVN